MHKCDYIVHLLIFHLANYSCLCYTKVTESPFIKTAAEGGHMGGCHTLLSHLKMQTSDVLINSLLKILRGSTMFFYMKVWINSNETQMKVMKLFSTIKHAQEANWKYNSSDKSW